LRPTRRPATNFFSVNALRGSLTASALAHLYYGAGDARGALDDGDEDVEVYWQNHGWEALVTAAEYAMAYSEGRVRHRIMAREQDVPSWETVCVLERLAAYID